MPSELEVFLKSVFDVWGVKEVTSTDKNKSAYVLNSEQVNVLEQAGITPSPNRPADPFDIVVIFDDIQTVRASYYHSERITAPNRVPEPRMGREFISRWLNIGDKLFLATDGEKLFACKLTRSSLSGEQRTHLENQICSKISDGKVQTLATNAPRQPEKMTTTREEFARSPFVAEAARRRARRTCEMPGCTYVPFLNGNGDPYLEVHHILPLSEGGYDSLENVAALCANCHRAQHSSQEKERLRYILSREITRKGSAQ